MFGFLQTFHILRPESRIKGISVASFVWFRFLPLLRVGVYLTELTSPSRLLIALLMYVLVLDMAARLSPEHLLAPTGTCLQQIASEKRYVFLLYIVYSTSCVIKA